MDSLSNLTMNKQRERDRVKNVIFGKYHIPILPLSTVRGGYKLKLLSVLVKINVT